MNLDTWGEVINGPDTYLDLWSSILPGKAMLIGWTDGRGTHYDVSFVLGKYSAGHIQRLHRTMVQQMEQSPILFVSILGVGAFGFAIGEDEALHPEYVAEKLNIGGPPTAEALTVLLNGLKSIYMGKPYETEIKSAQEGQRDSERPSDDEISPPRYWDRDFP